MIKERNLAVPSDGIVVELEVPVDEHREKFRVVVCGVGAVDAVTDMVARLQKHAAIGVTARGTDHVRVYHVDQSIELLEEVLGEVLNAPFSFAEAEARERKRDARNASRPRTACIARQHVAAIMPARPMPDVVREVQRDMEDEAARARSFREKLAERHVAVDPPEAPMSLTDVDRAYFALPPDEARAVLQKLAETGMHEPTTALVVEMHRQMFKGRPKRDEPIEQPVDESKEFDLRSAPSVNDPVGASATANLTSRSMGIGGAIPRTEMFVRGDDGQLRAEKLPNALESLRPLHTRSDID